MAYAEVFQCGALCSNSKIIDDHGKLFATGDRTHPISLQASEVASYVFIVHTKIFRILRVLLVLLPIRVHRQPTNK